jgi:hypothetical protein
VWRCLCGVCLQQACQAGQCRPRRLTSKQGGAAPAWQCRWLLVGQEVCLVYTAYQQAPALPGEYWQGSTPLPMKQHALATRQAQLLVKSLVNMRNIA